MTDPVVSAARRLGRDAGWVWDVTIGADQYKVAWTGTDRRLRVSWRQADGAWHRWVALAARYGTPGDLLDADAAVHAWAGARADRVREAS